MPTFGSDTIRRFSNNVSELKKLAARDFADLLQVGISPVNYLFIVTELACYASAPLRPLMVFSMNRTTRLSWNCYSYAAIGTV